MLLGIYNKEPVSGLNRHLYSRYIDRVLSNADVLAAEGWSPLAQFKTVLSVNDHF